ncbi:hypothetical protein AAZX31_18G135400 [Glycine max]
MCPQAQKSSPKHFYYISNRLNLSNNSSIKPNHQNSIISYLRVQKRKKGKEGENRHIQGINGTNGKALTLWRSRVEALGTGSLIFTLSPSSSSHSHLSFLLLLSSFFFLYITSLSNFPFLSL